MAIRTIVEVPDPLLRQISTPVDKVDDEIRVLIADMFETMFHRSDELGRETTVRHQHHSNHSLNSLPLFAPLSAPALSSILSFGADARSRCRIFGAYPAARKRSAISTAAVTDRCLPPVQPNAMVK